MSLMKKNATEWESHVHACVEYLCDREFGPILEVVCESTEQQKRVCMNDGCLEISPGTRVEIDINTMYIEEFDMVKVSEAITDLTGLQQLKVGVQPAEETFMVRVVVLVPDESSGATIVDAVNRMDRGKGCEYGTLCRAKTVRLVTDPLGDLSIPLVLSEGKSNHNIIITMMLVMILMVLAIVH